MDADNPMHMKNKRLCTKLPDEIVTKLQDTFNTIMKKIHYYLKDQMKKMNIMLVEDGGRNECDYTRCLVMKKKRVKCSMHTHDNEHDYTRCLAMKKK